MIKKLFLLIACTMALVSLLACFSNKTFIFELLSHFRLHYLWSSAVLLVVSVVLKQYLVAGISIILILFNGSIILPWYLAVEPKSTADQLSRDLKVVFSNVQRSNQRYADVISMVKRESADIVVLEEVNDHWISKLAPLESDYPNKILLPKENHFGIAIYSLYPLSNVQEMYTTHVDIPSVIATADIDGVNINIVATHPPPPMSPVGLAIRNAQLEALGRVIADLEGPTVLIGDLNITMWSWYYQELERQSNLRNARYGFGIGNTWPTNWYLPKIPIDHVLISDHIIVKNMQVLKSVGSDHLPIAAELSIPGG